MADMMTFPETAEEFMEQYKVVDDEGIYMSKGSELVPIFRMNQWFAHMELAEWLKELKELKDKMIHCRDCAWWVKQIDSLQGRCVLHQTYPTGSYYCGSAERKHDDRQEQR